MSKCVGKLQKCVSFQHYDVGITLAHHNWLVLNSSPCSSFARHLDVSKNRGILPPKWMVKIMENPIKMDDLGVPLFLDTPI